MNIQKCIQCFIIASSAVFAASFARADDAEASLGFGAIRGVALDTSGQPLARVTVAIRSWDGSIDRMAVSDGTGVFMADRLKPGPYRMTASKEGLASAPVTTVEVAQNQISRPYVVLAAATPAAAAAPAALVAIVQELQAMKERIAVLEAELKAHPATAAAPVPAAAITAAAVPPAAQTPSASKPQVGGKAPTPSVPPRPVPIPHLPEALEAPEATPGADNFTPFAFGNFTWLNGTPRNVDTVLDTKFFTPEVRFDTNYMEDFNQPLDHTIVGATESFRSGEVQVEQISVGGDFHWQNVRGRILTMFGMFATTTPRNDASFGVGQWDLRGAYKYTSEAYGGYHFNVNHGLNVDAGIFVSYIGLFSYYNFDNWTYQPSYVSSNTPWFFNGVRVQWFPTNKLKIEPWFINGWQSYAKYNSHPGLGGQLLWMPKEWFKLVANQYGYGQDNLGLPHTERLHTDDSIEVRYYHDPENLGISQMAFSLTGDAGCQYGGGLQCTGAPSKNKESFLGWMAYDRIWFHKNLYAFTLGGGEMSNWGRYLTLLPPINGADAVTGSPYFPESPGLRAHMWDSTVNFQYMPREYITWWTEVGYRHADIPYFAGRGGVTPPGYPFGGTNGAPGQYACMSGAPSGATDLPTATMNCASAGGVWFPDLRRSEAKLSFGVMVKF
ncbi:MAG TPA: TonB-dependent receptor [Bryobacteraceae bacterium]|nr:TonB-dependent receptor [Bryobacteraceae bacterium]